MRILSDNSSDEARASNSSVYGRLQDSSGTILHNSSKQILLQQTRKATHYGTYYVHINRTVQTSVDNGTGSAMYWFANESLTKFCRIKRIELKSTATAATSFQTAPRYVVRFCAYRNGLSGGGAQTPCKRSSTDASQECVGHTTNPTSSPELIGEIYLSHIVSASSSATGAGVLDTTVWNSNNDQDCIVLAPTNSQNLINALVIYQVDSGSTSDTRRIDLNIVWEEYI